MGSTGSDEFHIPQHLSQHDSTGKNSKSFIPNIASVKDSTNSEKQNEDHAQPTVTFPHKHHKRNHIHHHKHRGYNIVLLDGQKLAKKESIPEYYVNKMIADQ